MIEDKLNHDERVRLECIAQAVASSASSMIGKSPQDIIEAAEVFEAFVHGEPNTEKLEFKRAYIVGWEDAMTRRDEESRSGSRPGSTYTPGS